MNPAALEYPAVDLLAKDADRKGHWMQTFTGRKFYPADPRAGDIAIEDIAHGLARVCRFGGHCAEHYSVAQHSVLVSLAVEANGGTPLEVRHALLHDAAEAYVGDVVWPLKQAPGMIGYKAIERRVEDAVAERFDLPREMPGIVKYFDLVLLATEKRDVMDHEPDGTNVERQHALARLGEWHCDVVCPLPDRIVPAEAKVARAMFLSRWSALPS